MDLAQLAANANVKLADGAGAHVTGFAIDHRKVAPGTVFGAFRGAAFNAEDVIPEAIAAGAVAFGGPVLYACARNGRRNHGHQWQNIDGGNDAPDLAHVRRKRGVDRDARSDYVG